MLVLSVQLPKAKETSAMSGAGFMRLVKNVGDSFTKMAGRKGDVDTVSPAHQDMLL